MLLTSFFFPSICIHRSEGKEFCQFESFNASCAPNQVIVMAEAQYGRLRTGRCVSRDYGYIGCSMNVLHLLDRVCSGRRWCDYGVPKLRDLVQPCPKDLISYLEASYRCITGQCPCPPERVNNEYILGSLALSSY